MPSRIPVSRPALGSAEIEFAHKALSDGAISGVFGEYIGRFEQEFAEWCGVRHAVACSNGTTALHLALLSAGVGEGDEVLVSTLTNMASFFAVIYCGARPIPVDVSRETLTMDPADLARKLTSRSRAIMVVHLFGQPTDMDPICEIAQANGLKIVEDCAEAHGALYNGRMAGALGDVGAFSFFANKIITTGEGGMITTDDAGLAAKARSLKALAFGPNNKFMHDDVGYNYRMTNLQAAIGCGQMQRADALVERRREIGAFYTSRLAPFAEHLDLPAEMPGTRNVIWMYHLVLKGALAGKRSQVMAALAEAGVETREGFVPYNLQKIFIERGWTKPEDCPVAASVAYESLYLPTGGDLTANELDHVAASFGRVVESLIG
jgi:perosamine synthetase